MAKTTKDQSVKAVKPAAKQQAAEQKSVADLQQEIVMKKMELRMGKLKDVRSISRLRDQIARIKTAERIKELTIV